MTTRGEVDAGALDDVHLLHRAARAALVRGVGEDGDARPQVRAGDGAVHLALVGAHLERRGDLAEGAPALGVGVGHQLLDQLVLRHLGHAHRVDGEADVLEVAAGHHDADLATGRDGVQVLHLLGRPPAGGGVDDAAEAVEGAGAQLLHRELDVGPADVLVEEGGAFGQILGGQVALQGPDDRALREVGRGHAREGLLGPGRDPAGRGGEAGAGGGAEEAQRVAPRVLASVRMLRVGHGVLRLRCLSRDARAWSSVPAVRHRLLGRRADTVHRVLRRLMPRGALSGRIQCGSCRCEVAGRRLPARVRAAGREPPTRRLPS